MKENTIKQLIQDFHNTPLPIPKIRALNSPLDTKKILSIVGPRRAGKTTYCFSLIQQLIQSGKPLSHILYINFEDERLDQTTEELDCIVQQYQILYPEIHLQDCTFIFDEIQNIPLWERFVRRIYDHTCKNIIVTGSNAKALSKDIATSLRGRTLSYEILPLSFKEYLEFLGSTTTPRTTTEIAKVQNHLNTYLIYGGFPETVEFDPHLKIKILQEYFEVMMYRDIGERAGISQSSLLRFFLKRSFSSNTKSYSINKIYHDLKSAGYKIGKNSLYELAELCKQAYVFFTVPKYTQKIANIELGEKKIFAIDNGILTALGLLAPTEVGKQMEQVVFLESYKRYGGNLFFDANGYECDLLVGEWDSIHTAIQITQTLEDPSVKKREIKGLLSACKKTHLNEGLLLTLHEEATFTEDGVTIQVKPLWKWLLNTPH